ncbi:MAG: hypothetical protein MHM6MM_003448 [Cercozoa sp. M6MM]
MAEIMNVALDLRGEKVPSPRDERVESSRIDALERVCTRLSAQVRELHEQQESAARREHELKIQVSQLRRRLDSDEGERSMLRSPRREMLPTRSALKDDDVVALHGRTLELESRVRTLETAAQSNDQMRFDKQLRELHTASAAHERTAQMHSGVLTQLQQQTERARDNLTQTNERLGIIARDFARAGSEMEARVAASEQLLASRLAETDSKRAAAQRQLLRAFDAVAEVQSSGSTAVRKVLSNHSDAVSSLRSEMSEDIDSIARHASAAVDGIAVRLRSVVEALQRTLQIEVAARIQGEQTLQTAVDNSINSLRKEVDAACSQLSEMWKPLQQRQIHDEEARSKLEEQLTELQEQQEALQGHVELLYQRFIEELANPDLVSEVANRTREDEETSKVENERSDEGEENSEQRTESSRVELPSKTQTRTNFANEHGELPSAESTRKVDDEEAAEEAEEDDSEYGDDFEIPYMRSGNLVLCDDEFNCERAQKQMSVVAVAAGTQHFAVITKENKMLMWGNATALSVDNDISFDAPLEAAIPMKTGDAPKKVSCGSDHTVVLTHLGHVFTQGNGEFGKLCLGGDSDQEVFCRVKLDNCTDIDASQYLTGIVSNGKAYICGANDEGHIVAGDALLLKPTELPVENVTQIAVGDSHVAVLDMEGKVHTLGGNEFSQQGRDVEKETLVDLPEKCTQVSAAGNITHALLADGSVWSWGSGETHQMGIMDNADQAKPVKALLPKPATLVSAGTSLSVAVCGGCVYAWGWSVSSPVPKELEDLNKEAPFVACSAGAGELILSAAVTQRVFGLPLQEGTESVTLRDQAFDGVNVTDVAVFNGSDLVASRDTLLLFDEGTCTTTVPVGARITHLAGAAEHFLALREDGQVSVAGTGTLGKLGTGFEKDVDLDEVFTLPKETFLNASVAKVCASNTNSGAIDELGRAWIWGT